MTRIEKGIVFYYFLCMLIAGTYIVYSINTIDTYNNWKFYALLISASITFIMFIAGLTALPKIIKLISKR
jgi:hypothetical protein